MSVSEKGEGGLRYGNKFLPLLKEQMIIPVKKTLNSAGHIDAKLINFSEICPKKFSEISCFLLIVSWQSFPPEISPEIG